MNKEINLLEQEIEPSIYSSFLSPFEDTELAKDEAFEASQKSYDREKCSYLKQIMESLLFTSSEPISFNKLREVLDSFYPVPPRILRGLIEELQKEYDEQKRSFQLAEIAQGYLLRTRPEFSPYLDLLYRNKRKEKLSHASAEVLAIIAYRGPVTRPQIDAIRGVDSSGIVQSLLDRQLIEPAGKLDAPGRPTLYATTKDFLKHFGLRDTSELPKF